MVSGGLAGSAAEEPGTGASGYSDLQVE